MTSETERELAASTNSSDPEEEDSAATKDVDSIEPDLPKSLPPEAKKVLEVGMSMRRFGAMPNPIAEKINERHIDKILDIAEKDEERSFKDTGESRKFTLVYILIFAAIFVFTTVFLADSDRDLYKEGGH